MKNEYAVKTRLFEPKKGSIGFEVDRVFRRFLDMHVQRIREVKPRELEQRIYDRVRTLGWLASCENGWNKFPSPALLSQIQEIPYVDYVSTLDALDALDATFRNAIFGTEMDFA